MIDPCVKSQFVSCPMTMCSAWDILSSNNWFMHDWFCLESLVLTNWRHRLLHGKNKKNKKVLFYFFLLKGLHSIIKIKHSCPSTNHDLIINAFFVSMKNLI